jgi:hypothetical protein
MPRDDSAKAQLTREWLERDDEDLDGGHKPSRSSSQPTKGKSRK